MQNQNWVVVFKSLVTLHHMMCYGNERFIQYLASSNTSFQLSNFLDKSGVNGKFALYPIDVVHVFDVFPLYYLLLNVPLSTLLLQPMLEVIGVKYITLPR